MRRRGRLLGGDHDILTLGPLVSWCVSYTMNTFSRWCYYRETRGSRARASNLKRAAFYLRFWPGCILIVSTKSASRATFYYLLTREKRASPRVVAVASVEKEAAEEAASNRDRWEIRGRRVGLLFGLHVMGALVVVVLPPAQCRFRWPNFGLLPFFRAKLSNFHRSWALRCCPVQFYILH